MGKDIKITRIHELVYDLRVNEGMTKDVIMVNPGMKMSNLRGIFRSNRLTGVPVAENSKVVGLISIEDYIKWLSNGEKDCSVAEKMTKKVKTIFENSPFVEALKKFDKFGFGRFPVINDDLKLVGIITKGDIIKCILRKLESVYLNEDIHTYRANNFFDDIAADKTILRFHYFIKGKDLKHAGECASALKKTLKRLGFNPQVIRRVAIATYEAEMNMIIYSKEGEIIAEVEKDKLKISAQDIGPGIEDIEKAMQPGYSTAPNWVREFGFGAGMGLYNIKKCSDEMVINSTIGKGTHLEINISPEYNMAKK